MRSQVPGSSFNVESFNPEPVNAYGLLLNYYPKIIPIVKTNVGVHGFKGSGVQGSILVPGLQLGCVFTKKASASSSLIQYLKPNWQLLEKMNICNEDFGSSMPFFVHNPERLSAYLCGGVNPEPVNAYDLL
jgi:hypothetical protein